MVERLGSVWGPKMVFLSKWGMELPPSVFVWIVLNTTPPGKKNARTKARENNTSNTHTQHKQAQTPHDTHTHKHTRNHKQDQNKNEQTNTHEDIIETEQSPFACFGNFAPWNWALA